MDKDNDTHGQLCCRLCSQSTNVFYLQSITDNIRSKLSTTFKIQLKDDDSLPKNICQDCNEKLDESFNFFKHISYIQRVLKGNQDDEDPTSENSFGVDSNVVKNEHFEDPIVREHHGESILATYLMKEEEVSNEVSWEVFVMSVCGC